jgi:hypothetical protein
MDSIAIEKAYKKIEAIKDNDEQKIIDGVLGIMKDVIVSIGDEHFIKLVLNSSNTDHSNNNNPECDEKSDKKKHTSNKRRRPSAPTPQNTPRPTSEFSVCYQYPINTDAKFNFPPFEPFLENAQMDFQKKQKQ